jgi:tRNA (guanosine-2'-O-)-methyltransferase
VSLNQGEIDRVLDAVGPDLVVARLQPFVTEARRARIERALEGRLLGVGVAVENPHDPHNAAAVVRSAEAFGAGHVHVIGPSATILRSRRTTAGTHHWLATHSHGDLDGFFAAMHREGITVAAACVDAELALEDLPVDHPICLLFGNEHVGLSAEAKRRASAAFVIRTHGFAESLNLSVSAAVSLYVVTTRMRGRLGRASDLTPQQAIRERARGYLRSVDPRLARGLFAPAAAAGEG